MATFISKEELLGGARNVPIVEGMANQPAAPSIFSGSGSGLDQIERMLMQINSVMENVNKIRNNALIRGDLPGAPAQIAAAPAPQAPSSGAVTYTPKKPELNEEGAKQLLAELINLIESAPDSVKNGTLSGFALDYKNPIKKDFIEQQYLSILKNNLGRLIK
jgi:hypothetical protein